MKRLFGGIPMTWLRTVLFAAAAGIYTGLVMTIPFLDGTSFQDIGVSYEWWVIFAVIVVVNCGKGWEAALKCFVFFLISQPLVYLTEILLGALESEMGLYYYRAIWLPMTMLTLPGGFIAYFCKQQTPLGAFILGLGNAIQAMLALVYFLMAVQMFPYHLLSALVSLGSIPLMTLLIQKERKNRLIAFLVPAILCLLLPVLLKVTGRTLF